MSAIHQILLGMGGEAISPEAADTFTGVSDGAVSTVNSGSGWAAAGVIEDPLNDSYALDLFTGLSDGAISTFDSGTGDWDGDGIIENPVNEETAVDVFTGLSDGVLASFDSGVGLWDGDGVINDVPPTALNASDKTDTSFVANWSSLAGNSVTGYRLDVSTESDFSSFVSGYENLDVGLVTTYDVDSGIDLTANDYYYRVRSYNGVATTISSNVITVTAGGAGYTYHKIDYGSGGLVGLSEIKFTLDDNSDYPLTSSTLTSPHGGWSYLGIGSLAGLGNGVLSGELAYAAGSGGYVSVIVETPVPVAVKEVLTGTQANYNGPFNLPQSLRYHVSDNGTDWTLVKTVAGVFPGDTGYIVKNVEP